MEGWIVWQLDIKSAFLKYFDMEEEIFMALLPGFSEIEINDFKTINRRQVSHEQIGSMSQEQSQSMSQIYVTGTVSLIWLAHEFPWLRLKEGCVT
jgi:hypothetical protein